MGILNKLPVFQKCCFCIPLRIGVAIVGYWSIFVFMMTIGYNINIMASMAIEISPNIIVARTYMVITLNIIINVVYVVLSAMLLIGAHKKKPDYLRHFFVWSLVMIKVHVICLVFGFIYQRHWLQSVYLLWIGAGVPRHLLILQKTTEAILGLQSNFPKTIRSGLIKHLLEYLRKLEEKYHLLDDCVCVEVRHENCPTKPGVLGELWVLPYFEEWICEKWDCQMPYYVIVPNAGDGF